MFITAFQKQTVSFSEIQGRIYGLEQNASETFLIPEERCGPPELVVTLFQWPLWHNHGIVIAVQCFHVAGCWQKEEGKTIPAETWHDTGTRWQSVWQYNCYMSITILLAEDTTVPDVLRKHPSLPSDGQQPPVITSVCNLLLTCTLHSQIARKRCWRFL